ncbi:MULTISPECIES: glycosyltransferase [Hyphomicrobiales]|uniref:glycosyltransferase n=1 Tax=Hyphomicrobiales TaxID=356 RepID=UPI003B013E84
MPINEHSYDAENMGEMILRLSIGSEVDWSPEHLAMSAWIEHLPFAFWLMKILRPRMLVELGTDKGTSYAGFCQAVESLHLDTNCFAVDTWKGDQHAGYYDESVFSVVSSLNDQRYKRFSSLMRTTFDEAITHFADGEIDVLHIDGLHTYEAARNDFEGWKPKLSKSAVVLFHDTNVRQGDFGVWRLWNELAADYPHFEFLHGYGLGVLGVGTHLPAPIRHLFESVDNRSDLQGVRSFFAARGAAVQAEFELRKARADSATLAAEVAQLVSSQDRLERELTDFRSVREVWETERDQLKAEACVLRTRAETHADALADLSSAKEAWETERDELKAEVYVLRTRAEQAALDYAHLSELSARLRDELESIEGPLSLAKAHREALLLSTSWRVTAPMRGVSLAMQRLGGQRKARHGWIALQSGRVRRIARLVPAMSQRAGGPINLARLGVRTLLADGVGGVRAKLRSLETGTIITDLGLSPCDPNDTARDIFAKQQSELTIAQAVELQKTFVCQPLISVIMPVYKTPVKWLRRVVESLQAQYYDRWELCAVDDCSPTDEQRNLLKELAAGDPRVRFSVMEKNGGISAASNVSLQMARGEFIALVDHDDELTPDAFFRVVEALNQNPDADFLYSDECKVDDTEQSKLFHFVFKPDWSPEIMLNSMVTGHLTVYRRNLVESVGGFRGEYDFSQDYDLALRMSEATDRIVHIERILYLWRAIPGSAASGGKDYARESNIAALNDSFRRRGIPAEAQPGPLANIPNFDLPFDSTKVSIVIPSDSARNLRLALDAIRVGTGYPNYEVVVVCNGPVAELLSEEYADWKSARFIKYDKKYNFSDKCNEGARAAHGDIVVFYNDDVFPMQNDWIERLIECLWIPGVGGVSPKLLYEDDTIQYAGMISGTPGLCGTAYNHVHVNSFDSFLTMHQWIRNVSILSGACCALRKETFLQIGAFDEVNTPDGHSDMDLSYKLIESGLRCVYNPHAVLRHIGNHSWGSKKSKYKADIFALKRWGSLLSRDPNFTESMKAVLYRDFTFEYRIFADHIDPHLQYSGPDVLFASHELTMTGAPRMLFHAAKIVKERGGFPVVVAPSDGPLRHELVQEGIVVIIDASMNNHHFLVERFARNFDLVVANTMETVELVKQLSRVPILRTIWWLHEAKMLAGRQSEMKGVSWERIQAVCVSDYARRFMSSDINVKILHNGIPDQRSLSERVDPTSRFTFLVSGTVEPRKGQDIFVEAIAALPEEIRLQCRFILTGKFWSHHHEYWENIKAQMVRMPEIEYIGVLDHKAQLEVMAGADVLVCCSRDESFSLVVAEAAMLSTPIILSDAVGVSTLFDRDSSFMFETGDALSLAEQMRSAFMQRDTISQMGAAARRVFEKELSLEIFAERFAALMEEHLEIEPTVSPRLVEA